jgi:hypothetical protein
MIVDSLMVAANNRAGAERKIVQIYRRCEILDCHELQQAVKEDEFDLESAITLIGKEAQPKARPKKIR